MFLFFERKNPTPNQLALITTTNISIVIVAVALFMKLLFHSTFTWWALLIFVFAAFISCYVAISYALKRFIYRKIKLIYKTIHTLKTPKGEISAKINMNAHMIDDVEKEVEEWTKDRTKEIEDLKKMEAYRRDFFGNVSHELKTPIFNIQGYLYTLLEGGLNDEKINVKYLERAAKNVERINAIVEDLGVISKLEAGELELDYTSFDIHQLAKDVLDDLEMKASKRQVTLDFKDGSNKSFFVRGDREGIRQVLTNLVTNSIKYGREGGETNISFYDMDSNILIEVTDNGEGIKEEHLSRLFERFYRVDKGRSRDQGGTGLGLAIVKHIIEAHNQTITVRSRVGLGSTFGFTLTKP